jgi:hypothetical protein
VVRVSLFPACVIRGLLAEFCSRGCFVFFLPFVRNRVVLFCGLVAERQYNPPSSSSSSTDIMKGSAGGASRRSDPSFSHARRCAFGRYYMSGGARLNEKQVSMWPAKSSPEKSLWEETGSGPKVSCMKRKALHTCTSGPERRTRRSRTTAIET